MTQEWVDRVDGQDRVLGQVTRAQMRAENLLHRSVAILCKNRRGQIYVQRRADTKDVFPGLHDMFVGGVVAAGETYDEAARREIAEELGITGGEPRYLFFTRYEGPHSRALIRVYEVVWDGPIVHCDGEVAWGRFFDVAELDQALADGLPVVPDGALCYAEYAGRAS